LLIVQLIISGVKKYPAGFPVRVPLTWREKHMDIKKLFMNNKAVSPVIGVILMVAITVILAAAIGSSVFGQGTAESAPQANLDIQAGNTFVKGQNGNTSATVRIEHLGGDPINFDTAGTTKIMASVNGTASETLDSSNIKTQLGVLNVGDVKTLKLSKEDNSASNEGFYLDTVNSGSTVNIKIIDIKTNQLICDKTVRF
jgi:flagellin-like protein